MICKFRLTHSVISQKAAAAAAAAAVHASLARSQKKVDLCSELNFCLLLRFRGQTIKMWGNCESDALAVPTAPHPLAPPFAVSFQVSKSELEMF